VNGSGGLYAKDGLGDVWTHEASAGTAAAIQAAGDRIGFLAGGMLYVKQGLGGTWVHEADGVLRFALTGSRLVIVNGSGGLYAKDGLGDVWTHEASAGTAAAIQAAGDRIGFLAGGRLYVKQGLGGTWVHEADGVKVDSLTTSDS
jgi:uncharacterized cupin superfamily protein